MAETEEIITDIHGLMSIFNKWKNNSNDRKNKFVDIVDLNELKKKNTRRKLLKVKFKIKKSEVETWYQKFKEYLTNKKNNNVIYEKNNTTDSLYGRLMINNQFYFCFLCTLADPTKHETKEVKNINDKLDAIKETTNFDFVQIYFKGKTYKIKEAVQIKKKTDEKGNPTGIDCKADICFIDNEGKECLWLSHKKGTKPSQFLQYGGVTAQAGTSISTHTEVQKFKKDVLEKLNELYGVLKQIDSKFQKPSKPTMITNMLFMKKINSDRLKNMAVYGKDFGTKPLGRDNVAFILQGNLVFKCIYDFSKQGKPSCYIIAPDTATQSKLHFNGEVLKGEYEPVLAVIHGDSKRHNFDIEECRAGIYPKEGKIL